MPEQVVFEVLVVTLSIASEKVTETLLFTETSLWLSAGEVEDTVGGIPSITMALLAPSEPVAPGAGRVRVASPSASLMVAELSARELVVT